MRNKVMKYEDVYKMKLSWKAQAMEKTSIHQKAMVFSHASLSMVHVWGHINKTFKELIMLIFSMSLTKPFVCSIREILQWIIVSKQNRELKFHFFGYYFTWLCLTLFWTFTWWDKVRGVQSYWSNDMPLLPVSSI